MASSTTPLPTFVRIKHTYPHHESLRGAVGVLHKTWTDGTVCVWFKEGPHAGDRVCLSREYVEFFS